MKKKNKKHPTIFIHEEKGFFSLPNYFFDEYAQILGVHTTAVYSYIGRVFHNNPVARVSMNKIAKKLKIGKRKIIEAIGNLEFWDILARTNMGRGRPNYYKLNTSDMWKVVSRQNHLEFREVVSRQNSSGITSEPWVVSRQNPLKKYCKETNLKKETIEETETNETESSFFLKEQNQYMRIWRGMSSDERRKLDLEAQQLIEFGNPITWNGAESPQLNKLRVEALKLRDRELP